MKVQDLSEAKSDVKAAFAPYFNALRKNEETIPEDSLKILSEALDKFIQAGFVLDPTWKFTLKSPEGGIGPIFFPGGHRPDLLSLQQFRTEFKPGFQLWLRSAADPKIGSNYGYSLGMHQWKNVDGQKLKALVKAADAKIKAEREILDIFPKKKKQ